jgi:putative endonuclease
MLLSLAAKKRAYLKGRRSEWLAALFLRCKGYEILKTRFKTPVGEIDLLARQGKTLIAVEVKSRSSLERAIFSITPRQQRRIERALLYYLCRHKVQWSLRFDVILMAPWKWPYHIKGAWREGER